MVNNENHVKYSNIKKSIVKFAKDKVYHLHNSYHLGDNVFNLILFYIIKNYIVSNNIKIYYYAKQGYINQLTEFICCENIILKSLQNKPETSIEIWINNEFFNLRHSDQKIPLFYNKYYVGFFNIVLEKLYINHKLTKFYYEDEKLLERYNNLDDKFKNLDILVVNSQPLSGQYPYNKNEWDNYIVKLNNLFKISTTTKVKNILCTMDNNLSIKDIASLSTNVKVIIAINSGVVPGLLNIYTLKNIKKCFIFDTRCMYSYPNFENRNNINDIRIEELRNYTK
jgi:hypothetical protein